MKKYLWYLPASDLLIELQHKGTFKYVYELHIGGKIIIDTALYIGKV